MKQKTLAIFGLIFVSALALSANANAASAPTQNLDKTVVYANGTPVTISARGTDTVVSWGDGSDSEYVYPEGSSLSIFGGYNDDNSDHTSTSITMTGGTVDYIDGGGLLNSYVTNATINVTGGTINGAVSGGGMTKGSSLEASASPSTANNVVESVKMTIGANVKATIHDTYYPIVYAGGDSGYNYVGKAEVNVAGGNWAYVVGGGSNGTVKSSVVNITGGNINKVQGLNRGSVGETIINVTGGEIANLYAGADATQTAQPGSSIGKSTVKVDGTAKVSNISLGYQDSGSIDQDVATLSFLDGSILDKTGLSEFVASQTTPLEPVTIDGKVYEVEQGKTLADYDFSAIETKSGSTFAGFVDAKGVNFAENTPINSPLTLMTKFNAIAAITTNPNTGDGIGKVIALFGASLVVTIALGGIAKKRKLI